MKILFYVIITLAYILVTFFGLGPVILADGSTGERIITLFFVLLLYMFLGWIVMRFRKKYKE